MAFNWTCPHCSIVQSVVPSKQNVSSSSIDLKGQSEGDLLLRHTAIGCANADCLKTTIHVKIAPGIYQGGTGKYIFRPSGPVIFNQFLHPQGCAKPQPGYVPQALVEDYTEACLIRDLSPKASATLVRRCLQGMIRDFAKISKSRLIDEIKALRTAVDDGTADRAISIESVDAIDAVRGIGNIGAHMERDINEIIEVDPGEAQALIELVEMLFDEWYGARAKRQERLTKVLGIDSDKRAIKAAKSSGELVAPLGTNALLSFHNPSLQIGDLPEDEQT